MNRKVQDEIGPRRNVPVPRLWDAKSPNEWLEASFDSQRTTSTTAYGGSTNTASRYNITIISILFIFLRQSPRFRALEGLFELTLSQVKASNLALQIMVRNKHNYWYRFREKCPFCKSKLKIDKFAPGIGFSIRTATTAATSATGAPRSSASSSPAHNKLSTVRSVKQPGRSAAGISPSRKIEELMGLQVPSLNQFLMI